MEIIDIEQFVRHLHRSRGISLLTLAQHLGYRSQTSLIRIMQKTANRDSLLKFAEKLRQCPALALTEEEKRTLDDLIELRDLGSADFQAMQSMRRMLFGVPLAAGDSLLLIQPDGGSGETFRAHYGTRTIRRMLILNCERVPVFQDVALLMAKEIFPVCHCLFSGADAVHTVRAIHAALPILYAAQYDGRTFPLPGGPDHALRGLITSDLILCESVTAAGEAQQELIVFSEPGRGRITALPGICDALLACLPDLAQMQPIRIPAVGDDLLTYNAFCAELEQDHAVYRIKPDLGLEQLPVDILLRAGQEAAPPEILRALPALTDLFRRRHQNVLTKGKPQHTVLKRSAMLQFARTGRLSDHPWILRDFTLGERRRILVYLKEVLLALPGFHLHLLKDEASMLDDEVILYEGVGLSLIKPGTDYNWLDTHAEILITQPEFLQVYKQFYQESLLMHRVAPEAETRAFLDELISQCNAP